jgi:hypothetical protein
MSKQIVKTGNEALDNAIAGFIPTFASETDLRIVKDISKLHVKLRSIKVDEFRKMEREKRGRPLTSKMREIQRDEASLLRTIISRNMDF